MHSSKLAGEPPDSEVPIWACWRPPDFAEAVQREAGPPPVGRWERVLAAEGSIAQRVVPALARHRLLSAILRIPSGLANPPPPSVAARERRVEEVRQTFVGGLLERLAPPPPVRPQPARPDGAPPLGPALAAEVDRALEVLRGVPFDEIQRRGWHLVANHFAGPLNDLDFLRANPHLWLEPRWPAGIDFDLDAQEELMRRLCAQAGDLEDVPQNVPARPQDLVWSTAAFPMGDAYAYYGLVRELRPKRVVEVGAGNSSLVLARALLANGGDCDVTLVEPNPNTPIFAVLPKSWQFVERLVQEAGFEPFERLGPGDILFYDGSHCARTGSDVNWMFFEVFPRLQPGVWIHVHDIMWPGDYGVNLVLDNALSWNEQYVLQAFLMHNGSYRVRLSVAALLFDRGERLRSLFPSWPAFGGSVWIEKVA